MPTTATAAVDQTETARHALEEVCSGRDLDGIARDYHPDFVDHVNRLTYRGHEVASRWTLRGTHKGRVVELRGIVISRFEDGRIIEDWAASDTMEVVRQLGLWRTLQLAVKHRKLLLNPAE